MGTSNLSGTITSEDPQRAEMQVDSTCREIRRAKKKEVTGEKLSALT